MKTLEELNDALVSQAYILWARTSGPDSGVPVEAFLSQTIPELAQGIYASEYRALGFVPEDEAKILCASLIPLPNTEVNKDRLLRVLAEARYSNLLDVIHGLRCNTEKNTMGIFRGGYEGHLRTINECCRGLLARDPVYKSPVMSDWSKDT